MHVRLADESVCIGPPPSRDSYLNIHQIVAACEITGADAVHPGYGFLSENAKFADILAAHNITFIGPSGDHIRIMGDKIEAKRTAKRLGIPVVPGSDGAVTDEKRSQAHRRRDRLSRCIIKASAGGGGRGMKVARTEADLDRRLADGAHGSRRRLRRRRRLHREIPREAAPHRNPGVRRRRRQGRPSRRARLLAAAPPPEGLGRSQLAGPQRRGARAHRRDLRQGDGRSRLFAAPARSSSSTRTASSISSR